MYAVGGIVAAAALAFTYLTFSYFISPVIVVVMRYAIAEDVLRARTCVSQAHNEHRTEQIETSFLVIACFHRKSFLFFLLCVQSERASVSESERKPCNGNGSHRRHRRHRRLHILE